MKDTGILVLSIVMGLALFLDCSAYAEEVILFDFETQEEISKFYRVTPPFEQSTEHVTSGSYSGKIESTIGAGCGWSYKMDPEGLYPREKDWGDYKDMIMDVHNEGEAINLCIKLSGIHYHDTVLYEPLPAHGSTTIIIPLKRLYDLGFDLSAMDRVGAFLWDPPGNNTLYYDNVRFSQKTPSVEFGARYYTLSEDQGEITIEVMRNYGSQGEVSVDYRTLDGTAVAGEDYAPASGTLTWANGDVSLKTFSVTIIDNFLPEDEIETIAVELGNIQGNAVIDWINPTTIEVVDNDIIKGVRTTWQNSPKTTRSIAWHTTTPTVQSQVQYGLTDSYGKTATGASNVIDPLTVVHEAELINLQPGATYHYRVGSSAGVWSQDFTFTTEPQEDEPFVFFAGADPNAEFRRMGHVLSAAKSHDPDFFIIAGDTVGCGRPDLWKAWFDVIEDVLTRSSLTYMPSTGNHELADDPGYANYQAFNILPNGSGTEVWYSFDYSNVHFVSLDNVGWGSTAEQLEWLERDLSATDKDWKIVMFHAPPFSSGTAHGSNSNARENIVPILDRYHADLVISGHNHVYERSKPINYTLSSDAPVGSYQEGTCYLQPSPTGGAVEKSATEGNWWTEVLKWPLYTISKVTVTEDALLIEALDRYNNVFDQFTITKSIQIPQVLTINNGNGGGTYNYGDVISIEASIPIGQSFTHWSGDTEYIANVNEEDTTIALLADAEITANFIPGAKKVMFYDFEKDYGEILIIGPNYGADLTPVVEKSTLHVTHGNYSGKMDFGKREMFKHYITKGEPWADMSMYKDLTFDVYNEGESVAALSIYLGIAFIHTIPANGSKTITIPLQEVKDAGINLRMIDKFTFAMWGYPNNTLYFDNMYFTEGKRVQFDELTYSVAEGGGSIDIEVRRLYDNSGSVTVDYATSDGTATSGEDYVATQGTFSWADGDMIPKSFTIQILDDSLKEYDETINLVLSNPTGEAVVGESIPTVLTIIDDEIDIDMGIVGHWTFDDGGGEVALDSSGNNNHGTILNNPVWTLGVIGGALNFDGVNDYVEVVDSVSLNVDYLTMAAWVYREANSWDSRIIVDKGDSYMMQIGRLTFGKNDHFEFAIQPNWEWHDGGFVPLQEWAHVAVTWDGDRALTYINGRFTKAYDRTNGVVTDTTNALRIGARGAPNSARSLFKGKIDDVRIYNRVLNGAEIALLTQVEPGTNQPPLAQNQSVTTDKDTPVAITLAATDPDGDVLTYAIVTPPHSEKGSLSGEAPNLTYTPKTGFDGEDSFTFKASETETAELYESIATVTITVNPVSTAVQPPEPPREYIDTTYNLPTGGTTHYVNAGDDLQAAIDSAAPGDVIVLEASATFYGNFRLPNKTGEGWIYIISSELDKLPEGIRVGPEDSVHMPKIIVPQEERNPAFTTMFGAHNYRIAGIDISAHGPNYNLILMSYGLDDYANPLWMMRIAKTVDELPYNITFDRVYLHSTSETNFSRTGIMMDGGHIALVDSYLSNFKDTQDSQAIIILRGPGPYKFVNNYLESTGTNIGIGGGWGNIPEIIPSDIEFRNNYSFKPLYWKSDDPSYRGIGWTMKNLFEIKAAERVLISGNIFENSWVSGQRGSAVLFTVRNQYGDSPWAAIRDVTFENNIIRHVGRGFLITGADNVNPSQQTERILIRNNIVEDVNKNFNPGNMFFLINTPNQPLLNLTISHNLFLFKDVGSTALHLELPFIQVQNFVFEDNIITHGNYGLSISPERALDYIFRKNAIVFNSGEDEIQWQWYMNNFDTQYTTENFKVIDITDVGFTDYAGGDYRLSNTSLYRNAGTDGKDLGPDIDAVMAATAYAISGNPSPVIDGDVNTDGRVDIVDLVIVARAFGSIPGPGNSNWNDKADIDSNGIVNILDLLVVARNFGRGTQGRFTPP